jgi:putative phosphoesterase
VRIAVLSDIHDQTQNLRALLTVLAPLAPEALLLCGDITRPETLAQCRLPGARLHFCLGNCDRGRGDALLAAAAGLQAEGSADLGRLALPEGGGIAFCHFPAQARQAALSGRYRAVFYGHSHRPAVEHLEVGGARVLLANPGDVEARYGRVSALLVDSADWACTLIDA